MNLENCWASINIYNTFTWSVGNEKKIENTDRREVYYYNSIYIYKACAYYTHHFKF